VMLVAAAATGPADGAAGMQITMAATVQQPKPSHYGSPFKQMAGSLPPQLKLRPANAGRSASARARAITRSQADVLLLRRVVWWRAKPLQRRTRAGRGRVGEGKRMR
jgi:hypothetical protein